MPRKAKGPAHASMVRATEAPWTIEGTIRPLPIQLADSGAQPHVVLWVDLGTGMILAQRVIDTALSLDEGTSESLDALQGVLATAPPTRSGAVVVRTDARLADPARALLEPRGIDVEQADQLAAFDEMFSDLLAYLAAQGDEDHEPFAWEIDRALLTPLFKAAGEFARREPWTYLLDHPPIDVYLGAASPLAGVEHLYGSVLGAGGSVFGIAFYLSLDEYRSALAQGASLEPTEDELEEIVEELRRSGAPVGDVPREIVLGMASQLLSIPGSAEQDPPNQDAILCSFDPEDEVDASYLEWLDERGIEFEGYDVPGFLRTGHDFEPRELNVEEARATTLALSAVYAFLAAHRHVLRRGVLPDRILRHTAQIGGKKRGVALEISLPPEGYDFNADLVAGDVLSRGDR